MRDATLVLYDAGESAHLCSHFWSECFKLQRSTIDDKYPTHWPVSSEPLFYIKQIKFGISWISQTSNASPVTASNHWHTAYLKSESAKLKDDIVLWPTAAAYRWLMIVYAISNFLQIICSPPHMVRAQLGDSFQDKHHSLWRRTEYES